MTRKKQWGCLLLLLTGIALSWGVYECKYYYRKWADYRASPWAYSNDREAKLLVGTWKGSFKGPDKVTRNIELEIFVPTTEEERRGQASRRWKRASFSTRNKNNFDGKATVTSKLGREEYEISGRVRKDDYHQLTFDFRAADEKKRILPNFAPAQAKNGRWIDDQLEASISFSYYRADGSSFWSSSDPRHNQESRLVAKRVTNH